ncbi:MAG: hypothetical protein SGI92_07985 [Bryobacteraceae bacterium]|nr:hypothetical protein [Bryobacteraceae bacterium]
MRAIRSEAESVQQRLMYNWRVDNDVKQAWLELNIPTPPPPPPPDAPPDAPPPQR